MYIYKGASLGAALRIPIQRGYPRGTQGVPCLDRPHFYTNPQANTVRTPHCFIIIW